MLIFDFFCKRTRSIGAAAAFIFACVILIIGVQPNSQATIEAHWYRFGTFAISSGIFLAFAIYLYRYRRILTLAASVAVLFVSAALHPVCVPIADTELPVFESVLSLQERAERGEPFCKLEGHWFQCKTTISRAMFF